MEIWLDLSPFYFDGGKDCFSSHTGTEPLSFKEDNRKIQVGVFRQGTALYIQQVFKDRWLVCHPAGSGRIAILDSRAHFLLELFESPITLSHVMKVLPDWSINVIERAMIYFLELGFIQNLTNSSPLHEGPKNESLTAWIHITNACNLRCSYCYLQKTSENMADDIARRSVDTVFRSASKHGMKQVKIKYAGGEASLYMKRVTGIHDYAVQVSRDYNISLEGILLTNGVALSQNAIESLKARQIVVVISLDGLGIYHDRQRPFIKGQGSFRYVASSIERMLSNSLIPHISITVSQYNLEGIPELLEYILEREMPFTINYYRENECSIHLSDLTFKEEQMIATMRKAFEVIERHLPERSLLGSLIDRADASGKHQYTCSVGQNYLVIDQKGEIGKCHQDIKRGITTIEANDPLQIIRDDRTGIQGLSVEEKEGCRTCEWRYWCTGGCPLVTYKATGKYNVKSPHCKIYKALFPEVLRLEALRLLRYTTPVNLGNHVKMNMAKSK